VHEGVQDFTKAQTCLCAMWDFSGAQDQICSSWQLNDSREC